MNLALGLQRIAMIPRTELCSGSTCTEALTQSFYKARWDHFSRKHQLPLLWLRNATVIFRCIFHWSTKYYNCHNIVDSVIMEQESQSKVNSPYDSAICMFANQES